MRLFISDFGIKISQHKNFTLAPALAPHSKQNSSYAPASPSPSLTSRATLNQGNKNTIIAIICSCFLTQIPFEIII